MALTNHERVGKALELLRDGLRPFVERELKTCWGGEMAAGSQKCVERYPACRDSL